MKNNNDIRIWFIPIAIGFFIGVAIGYLYCKKEYKNKENNSKTPVEESKIDTLYLTRDSLIYRTKYLDSIKYDTIEKVYKLNDTATFKLFLQLVSE